MGCRKNTGNSHCATAGRRCRSVEKQTEGNIVVEQPDGHATDEQRDGHNRWAAGWTYSGRPAVGNKPVEKPEESRYRYEPSQNSRKNR